MPISLLISVNDLLSYSCRILVSRKLYIGCNNSQSRLYYLDCSRETIGIVPEHTMAFGCTVVISFLDAAM